MNKKQTTDTILMVEPVAFGFNEQTAGNNYFQRKDNDESSLIQQQAFYEFNSMTAKLREHGVNIIIIKDTIYPHTPDSIFPNNWITFHQNGKIAVYPMFAENRRLERRGDILIELENNGFIIRDIIDYTNAEKENKYLEGTGSILLDRINGKAYAALSERTDKDLFIRFCNDFQYEPVYFTANQTVNNRRLPIYHTNVMMCIGDKYVIVCLDSVDNNTERNDIISSFQLSGKEIIEISEEQMHCFAGNMLQLENNKGKRLLIMSESACNSLNEIQLEKLSSYNEIISVSIPTIEKYGGGSARCMMAEVFLNRRQ